jgi:aspartyl-tRNA(Asn)/glutamyl-tRNA(Gln) amidotransferase subunit A
LNLGYAKIIDSEVEENIRNSVEKFEQFGWNVDNVKMKMRKPELSYYTLYTVDFAYDFQGKLKEWKDKMDPDLVRMIAGGLGYSGIDVMKAIDQRKTIYKAINQIFRDYDILITPTAAVTAFELGIMFPPKINEKNVSPTAWQAFTFPINMTGHPAASIPSGWSKKGLPIGMQIIGKRFDELTVLQASKAFQEIAPWQEKKPQFN